MRLFYDDIDGESESPVKKKKKKTSCHIDLPMPPPITPPFKRHVPSAGSPVRIVAGTSDSTVNQMSSPATADHHQKSAVSQSVATHNAVSLTNLQSSISLQCGVEETSGIKSVNPTASPDLSHCSSRTSPRRRLEERSSRSVNPTASPPDLSDRHVSLVNLRSLTSR